MRFDELLKIYKIPEWDEYYFEYEELKKKIKELQIQSNPKTKNSTKEVTKFASLKFNTFNEGEFDSIKRSKTVEIPSHINEDINSHYFENLKKVQKFLQEYYDELNLDFYQIQKFIEENKIDEVQFFF